VIDQTQSAINKGNWKNFQNLLTHIERAVVRCNKASCPEAILMLINKLWPLTQKKLSQLQETRLKKQQDEYKTQSLDYIIQTGSIKKISPNQSVKIPPMLNHPDNPARVVDHPDKCTKIWHKHFSKVLHRAEPAGTKVPWMEAPSSDVFQEKTERKPFIWPQPINSWNLSALLARGNPKPAPGPKN